MQFGNSALRNRPKLRFCAFLILLITGCSTVSLPVNQVLSSDNSQQPKSLMSSDHDSQQDEIILVLAFSGGGTRSAALSYGVLKQLNKIKIETEYGKERTLLSEVDVISSVSGGSFTAAYYALYQDKIFQDYEQEFLKRDIKKEMILTFLSPRGWIMKKGRSETASDYYQEQLFGGATFGDIPDSSPTLIINASDITAGVRFSFTQEYFKLICSDVQTYPISKAVAASAAVPILFEPVVLENYSECNQIAPSYQSQTELFSLRIRKMFESIGRYQNKGEHRYVHLVDGGVTDNLGLLAISDLIEVAKRNRTPYHLKGQRHVVVISVDASTDPELGIGLSVQQPTSMQTLDAITDIQLHRYNDATKQEFMNSLQGWADEGSTENSQIVPHFIQIGISQTKDDERRFDLNQIPTDLTLPSDQIDMLILEGQNQIQSNPQIKQLISSLTRQ